MLRQQFATLHKRKLIIDKFDSEGVCLSLAQTLSLRLGRPEDEMRNLQPEFLFPPFGPEPQDEAAEFNEVCSSERSSMPAILAD